MSNAAVEFGKHGALVKVLVSSRDTRGDYAVCEVETTGPIEVPAHQHTYEDQWYHVLVGNYRFEVGGQAVDGAPGSCVEVPRQVTSQVSATEPGKLLVVARPGGLDMFFNDASCCHTDMLRQVLEKHGIVLCG